MQTRDSQLKFIRINGVRIAACAWSGYKSKGRGLVCVLSDLHNEVLQQVPFDFMPEVDASKLVDQWYGSKEARMTAGYDPRKEVVVCFVRQATGDRTYFDCYKVQTKPTPPDADEE